MSTDGFAGPVTAPSSVTATSTLQPLAISGPAFTMLGSDDAGACDGDSCLVPGQFGHGAPDLLGELEPSADEAAAASTRAVTAALDEGASL